MKKIIIIFSVLAVLLSGQSIMAMNQTDGTTEIPLFFPPTVTPGKPVLRTPAFISISAVYDSITECVVTTFTQNIGIVTVTLTNETTGETSTTTVDSSISTSTIQTSGTSGSWHVEYATSGGSTYEGDFEI